MTVHTASTTSTAVPSRWPAAAACATAIGTATAATSPVSASGTRRPRGADQDRHEGSVSEAPRRGEPHRDHREPGRGSRDARARAAGSRQRDRDQERLRLSVPPDTPHDGVGDLH